MVNKKIVTRFSIFLITFTLLLSLLAGLYFYRGSVRSNLTSSSCNTLENITEQQRLAFLSKLQDQKNSIRTYASFFEYNTSFEEDLLPALNVIAKNSTFSYITIAFPDGSAVENTGLYLNVSDRDYFTRALAGETVISNPIISKLTAEDVVAFATPIIQQNKITAVLIGIYKVQKLSDMLLPSFDGSGYTYITTGRGEIIVKTKGLGNLNLYNNLFDTLMVLDTFQYDNYDTILEKVYANKSGRSEYFFRDGKKLMEYKPIGMNGWYIFSIMPESTVIAQAAPIMTSTYVLAGGIVFIFILLLLYIGVSQKRHMKELSNIAFVDKLTGAATRKKFQITATEVLDSSMQGYAVVILDIDKFKVLNDTLGYACGDKLLICISNILTKNLHREECFGRCDSDEYYLLLEYEDDDSIKNRVLSLLTAIESEFEATIDSSYNLVVCAGIYAITEPIESINILCDKAKHAQQLIKGSQLSNVSFYSEELRNHILSEKLVENKMYDALEAGDFMLFLQPKYRLSDESICGAEALVRWDRGNSFTLYPDQFIPVFEKNGFIVKLDFYMLEKSCAFIKEWIDSGITPVPISINFSRLHLKSINFVDDIARIVEKYQVPPQYIEIELTESTMLGNDNMLISVLSHLHEHGFTLSMDDFGSGYSSLGLLKSLPVDSLKLDRTFFTEYNDLERAKTVISSMISMAKKLGICTVAEGVETREHVDLLIELDCDIVQGYYFAKPMQSSELSEFLAKNRKD